MLSNDNTINDTKTKTKGDNTNQVILCVDDDNLILTNLKIQLRNHFGKDYAYETALDAYEALELVDELTKEGYTTIIIVSDWLMAGIKGDELLIKLHEKYPNIIKIMLTGFANALAIENAKQHANLFACILKPWEEKTLIDTISSAINQYHSG